ETVKRGSTVLGIACDQGIVLAAEERPSSKLQDPSFTWKIFEIDEHVGSAISGLSSDARILVDRARIDAQSNRLTYDEPIDVETLSKRIGDIMQLYTQNGGVRPFGVAIIFGGVDKLGPQILQVDPSGAYWKYKAVAIGVGSDTVREILEAEYKTDFQLEDAVTLAVKCLTKVAEGGIVAENVRIVIIPTKTKKFMRLSNEEISKYISKL
ncbi:archaeal proteasome endopeptidase complex subunit alpha, partial [Candidatus Bathyarchaeota archaeon]|nr:archaeal proteasome endopeptidase complex subunit alpha [Candidatus Bathyarchaeota archaeon]